MSQRELQALAADGVQVRVIGCLERLVGDEVRIGWSSDGRAVVASASELAARGASV
jgi:hypothetical protein